MRLRQEARGQLVRDVEARRKLTEKDRVPVYREDGSLEERLMKWDLGGRRAGRQ